MDGNEGNVSPGSGALDPIDGQPSGEATQPKLDEATPLFIAAYPASLDGQKAVAIERRSLNVGGGAVLGFTTIDKLVEQLGEYQPWVAVRAGNLGEMVKGTEAEGSLVVLVDPQLDPAEPRWTLDRIREFRQAHGGHE